MNAVIELHYLIAEAVISGIGDAVEKTPVLKRAYLIEGGALRYAELRAYLRKAELRPAYAEAVENAERLPDRGDLCFH